MAKQGEEVDPTIYLDKAPSALQSRFAEWIQNEVGYNPAAAKTKLEAFQEGVRIATATRMVFQASPFNREANALAAAERAEARALAEREAAEAETAAPVKKAAPAKAAPAAKKAVAKKVAPKPAPEEETEEDEETPAPVKKAARRAPRRAPAATAEAPF
jgi:hypothetical protein